MDDSLHDTDYEIIDLTEIIELGPRIPRAASAAPAAEEGALPGGGDDSAPEAAGGLDLPAGDAGEQGAAAAEPPDDDTPAEDAPVQGVAGESGSAVTDVPHADAPMPEGGQDAPASSPAGIDQMEDDADAPGAESDAGAEEPALALMKTVGESDGESTAATEAPLEGDIGPTLEQRLEAAEKTIMALCAEVSKLRQRIALSDYSSEVVFIHAANPALPQGRPADAAMLPERSSASLEEAVTRVEQLESRMDGLEESSRQSAADAAARIIREEIEKLKRSR